MPRRHYPPANPARLYQQYPLEAGGGGEGGGGSVDLADYYRKSEADDYFVIAPASTPAAGDILYNIDGTDDGWTLLPIGTDGYVLKVATGFPSWAVNNAADADTLDGQHGTYYLDLANHTGRLPSDENLPLLPDGNVIIGNGVDNSTRALTLSDITADAGSPENYIFNGNIQFITSYSTASGYNYPFYSEATQSAPSTGGVVAGAFYAQVTSGSGTVAGMYGLEAYVASQGNHTITDAFGLYVWGGAENVSSVITNWYGVFLSTPDITGTITNKYGLYADNYGTSGYPIYTNQGIVSIGGFLQLRDATQYPVDSVLYVGASGTIEGSGAAATGDLLYNIDGSAWTSLPIGTANYVLKSVGGVPTWSVNNAADADTLDGQHGTYYLALSNATGTLAATKLQLLAEGTVFIGGASANETRALTAADISAGTFSGAFGFDTEVAMDIAANDTSFTTNTSSKWGGVNMSTGGTIPTDKPANYQYLANFGFKSRGFQISAAYGNDNDGFRIRRGSDNASSENGANVWQAWKQLALLEETQTFTGNKTFSGTSIFNNTVTINVNTYIYGTGSDRYVWMSLGNGVTNRYGGYGFQNNGSNRWLIRMMGDGTDDLQIYSYGVGGTATLWDYATGDLTHAHQLYLTDSVNYVVDGVLYVSSGGLVASSGAAATGDLLYNIDGTAWTSLAIGTEGYVLKSVSGIPTWSVNNASDADTLDGQHGAYYLAFSNATGTVSATQLQLLAEGTVFIGGASANTARALTAADISAGTFPGAAYTFTTNLTVGGKLTVDNDIFLSNGSNGAIKYDGTLVEFVASSDDTAVPGGWARGVEWNAGGAATNAAQVGTLGSGDSISYLYFSVGATSGTSDYNATDDAMRFAPNGILTIYGSQPEVRFYEGDAATDAKYWRLYAASGVWGLATMTDALGSTNTVFTITRNGNLPDYMNWRVHDIRIEADGNDAQYHRWYTNSTTGQTHLEFRRTSDSAMAHRFTSQASTGDFYFSWYNWSSLQHHWLFVDASASTLFTDGVWEWQGALHGHIYDNGTIASAGTLNVDWDNGNSQRCAASAGNITIDVDGASMRQGTTYTIQVINISTTADRNVTWSGVDAWVGSSPTTSVQQDYGTTVVQLYVARAQAGTDYVIGSVILDNTITPS